MRVDVVARTGAVAAEAVALAPLLDELIAAPRGRPFDDAAIALVGRLASRLMEDAHARAFPELLALGFFARPAELARLRRAHEARARADVVRVPFGLVFHVPPANVDTMSVFSWLLATLAGNASLVRLSMRRGPAAERLHAIVAEVLAEAGPGVAPSVFVRYPHDAAISTAISARCAMRVVWGGDATVAALRAVPLPPTARELTFPDRWSLTVLGAEAVAALDDAARTRLAESMATDLFGFGQQACASPRLALWIGDAAAQAAARARLCPAVAAVAAARQLQLEPATRLAREAFVYRVILDAAVVARDDFGPNLTVLGLPSLADVPRAHPGGGLLFEAGATSLEALDGWLTARDQTLTHAGLGPSALVALVERLGGRGLDRVVPVGRALALSELWDGHDLGAAFVRPVHVVGA